jgi:hypothetical protein
MDEENYYSSAVDKMPSVSKLSADEKEKIFGEFHKIALPAVGALAGFGATLTLAVLSADMMSNIFLFILLALMAVLAGGGGAFYLNDYYQKQNIPIWFRYLTVALVFYALGFLLDIVSCIVLPLLLIVVVGWLAAYIYKEKR